MWWEEEDVENRVEDYLLSTGWEPKDKPGRVRVDLLMEKEFNDSTYTLIAEVKGDVRNPSYDPAAYRNKYMQIIMGQLVCRTGVEQCGYDGHTILGLAIPDPCKDGGHYFIDYINERVAAELRARLRLCVITMDQDYQLSIELAPTIPEGLLLESPGG